MMPVMVRRVCRHLLRTPRFRELLNEMLTLWNYPTVEFNDDDDADDDDNDDGDDSDKDGGAADVCDVCLGSFDGDNPSEFGFRNTGVCVSMYV